MAKGPTKAQIKLYEEALKASKALGLSEEEQFQIEKQIYDQKIKTLKVLKDTLAAAKALQIEEKNRTKEQQRQQQLADQLAAKQKTQNDLVSQANQLTQKLQGLEKNLVTRGAERIDKAKGLVAEQKATIREAVKNKEISMDEALVLKERVRERQRELLALEANQAKAQAGYDLAEQGLDAIKSQFDEVLSYIPGGGMLSQFFGVDAAIDGVKTAAAEASSAMVSTMMKGGTALQGLTAAQGAFNATALANPYILLAAAIIATVSLLTKLAFDQTKAYKEQAEAVGTSVARAKEQVIAAKQISTSVNNQLVDYKEILEVQNSINKELGNSRRINAETAMEVANLGEAFGYGAETAAESTAAFMSLGASQTEALDLQRQVNLEALKAGVDMGKVQEDIAKNAKEVSKYLSGNPEALAKAAVQAAKLGTSLDQMGKTADALLDIESSMQAQFEFQAMTGKQINLNKARELALNGDIAGAMSEMVSQIGDINDFENMNVRAKQKMAKMMGMEVAEVEKMLRLQEFQGALTDDEIAKLSGLNLSAQELADLTAEEAQEKLASLQATEKMQATFAKLKQTVMNALQPLIDVTTMVIDMLMPGIDALGFALKVAFLPIKIAADFVKQIFEALQPIRDIFSDIFGKQLEGGNSILESISSTFSKIFKFALTPIKVAIQVIAKILGFVIKPIVFIIEKVFQAISFVIDLIGSAFEKIGGFIENLMRIPLQIIEGIANSIYNAFTFVGDALARAGDFLMNTILLPIKPFIWLFEWLSGSSGGDMEANINVDENGGDAAMTAQDKASMSGPNNPPEPLAKGGTAKGGLALVGEEGPELVQMPKGARVAPAGPTKEFITKSGAINSYAEGTGEMPSIESSGTDMSGVVSVLNQILSAVQQPPPVVIGEGAVASIGSKLTARKTFVR